MLKNCVSINLLSKRKNVADLKAKLDESRVIKLKDQFFSLNSSIHAGRVLGIPDKNMNEFKVQVL